MHLVLKGHELSEMSVRTISKLKPFPCVFARVSPEDKWKVLDVVPALLDQSLGSSLAVFNGFKCLSSSRIFMVLIVSSSARS